MPKSPDRVQLIKRESAAGGGDAADADDFYLETPLDPTEDAPEVQGFFFQDKAGGQPTDEDVWISRDGDDLKFSDKTVGVEVSLNDLLATASGSGITEVQHKALRDIIHFIDEGPGDGYTSGSYKEIIGQPFPTKITWYESSSKTQKIVEKSITRSGGGATIISPTPITWKLYDTDGITELVTVQDDIAYQGPFEISRLRTIIV